MVDAVTNSNTNEMFATTDVSADMLHIMNNTFCRVQDSKERSMNHIVGMAVKRLSVGDILAPKSITKDSI